MDGVQPVDLLSKPIQIGEYNVMTDEHCIYDEKYSSTERAIMIYDEDRDRFAKVDLNMALDNCHLFDENGNLRNVQQPETMSNEMQASDRLMDVFINKRTGQNVRYFGEIDPYYQPDDLLEKIGVVAAARAGKDVTGVVNAQKLLSMFGAEGNAFSGPVTPGFKQDDVVAAMKSGSKVAIPKKKDTAPAPSAPPAGDASLKADIKPIVSGFKDMIAATVRDHPDVQAQVRRFFPDHRAPSAQELDALKQFAARNAIGARFESPEAYGEFFDPRRAQFEGVLRNAGAPSAPKPSAVAAKSEGLLWIPVGEELPDGYEWLRDENGREIFSGFFGVNSVADLPFVRAQRALKAMNATVDVDADIGAEYGQPQQPRFTRQGFHIGMLEEFDESEATARKFVKENDEDFLPLLNDYVATIASLPLADEQKAAVLFFLGAPVNKVQFKRFITYNLPFPGNFLLCRAHATYRGRIALKCLAGQIGNTYMAHMNAEIGQDASRMIGLLHVVSYMSAIVTTPQHVYAEQAPYVDQYWGGLGMRFWDPASYRNRSARGNEQSILCFFVPYAEKTFPNPLDIAGRHYTEFEYGLYNVNNRHEALHYSTAYRYNDYYSIYTRNSALDELMVPTVIPDDVQVNRTCWMGAQYFMNRATNKFDIEIKNTGHWGPHVYAGVGAVRQGTSQFIEGTASIGVHVTN